MQPISGNNSLTLHYTHVQRIDYTDATPVLCVDNAGRASVLCLDEADITHVLRMAHAGIPLAGIQVVFRMAAPVL
jgi:hypothetical protein